jgi:hypothetical protein
MKIEDAITFFSSLSVEEQKEFLARLSHELTILGRDCYEIDTNNFTNPSQMRLINEIQHRIALHLLGLLKKVGNYPDDILVKMIIEHPEDKNFETKAAWAFEQTANKFLVAA